MTFRKNDYERNLSHFKFKIDNYNKNNKKRILLLILVEYIIIYIYNKYKSKKTFMTSMNIIFYNIDYFNMIFFFLITYFIYLVLLVYLNTFFGLMYFL